MDLFRPSKRRETVDRFSNRLQKSNFTGSDLAIAYLREKYSNNLAASTISSSGRVILSFLSFLDELQLDIEHVSNEVIGRYVDRDQDNGHKTGAIRTKCMLFTLLCVSWLIGRFYPMKYSIRKSGYNLKQFSLKQFQLTILNRFLRKLKAFVTKR